MGKNKKRKAFLIGFTASFIAGIVTLFAVHTVCYRMWQGEIVEMEEMFERVDEEMKTKK